MVSLDDIVQEAIDRQATDIHVEMDAPIYWRQGEAMVRSDSVFTREILGEVYKRCGCQVVGCKNLSVDAACTCQGLRIRVHLYAVQQKVCGTLRLLYQRQLGLGDSEEDKLLKDLSLKTDGLILITGPTGSGKSYTLASCITYINQEAAKHIVTLEDPVEYMFTNDKSLIHQRELHRDVASMAGGVRDALREDPDIIMIGELRDRETLEAALQAAETGHLVFATMHTQRAITAIQRMISLFPGEQQEEVRNQLAQVLRAIICQHLTRIDAEFVTIRDILLNTTAVSNLIRQKKEPQILSVQETQKPMQTMEMAVHELESKWGRRQELREVLHTSYGTV